MVVQKNICWPSGMQSAAAASAFTMKQAQAAAAAR